MDEAKQCLSCLKKNGLGEVVNNFRKALPTEEDVNGVSQHILRLVDVYGLDVGDLVSGKILSSEVEAAVRPMAMDECFRMASVAADNLMEDVFATWHEACMKVNEGVVLCNSISICMLFLVIGHVTNIPPANINGILDYAPTPSTRDQKAIFLFVTKSILHHSSGPPSSPLFDGKNEKLATAKAAVDTLPELQSSPSAHD